MSSGKRYAFFMLAMVAWVILYSLVFQPLFFPPSEKDPSEKPDQTAEEGEKKEEGKEKKTQSEDEKSGEDEGQEEAEDTAEKIEEKEKTSTSADKPADGKDESEFTFDLFDKEFVYNTEKSIPGEKNVYEYLVPGSDLTISKIYTINKPDNGGDDPKESDPYITNLTIQFKNDGDKEFKQKGYLISAGTVSLLNPDAKYNNIYAIIQGATTQTIKARSAIYTDSETKDGILWAGIINKYFASIIEPVTEDTRKSISRVVINGFLPGDEIEKATDGVLDESVPYLKNGHLNLMFQESGASVSNFILDTNSVVRGTYGEDGVLQRDESKGLSYQPTIIPAEHRAFAMRSLDVTETKEKSKAKKLCYSLAIGVDNIVVPAGGTVEQKFRLYVGPREYRRLKKLGYEKTMNFSKWLRPINILLLNVLHWFYSIFHNYGLAILALTLTLKLVLFPLDQKSYKSMKEMQKIQPLIAELKLKYKGDPKKAQLKQMELFREHKVNPLGGCLPMLLQLPILIAMFSTLRFVFELRGAPFLLWISDLSRPDALFYFGQSFLNFKSLNILPLFMVVAFYFQQKMSSTVPKDPNDPQYKQQQMMTRIFPLMFGFIFYNMQSGLTLYFTFSTFLRIAQQLWVIKKPEEHSESSL